MLALPLLTFLFDAVLGALAPVPVLFKRNETSTPGNPFASIIPSETLDWVPCYSDTNAAKIGTLECARLIVSAL